MDQNPDYKKIYSDIIIRKCPENKIKCSEILMKEKLTSLDVIKLNSIIFGNKNEEVNIFNKKHRSYTQHDILKILNYQKKKKLNNTELAKHFKLSRNTITKWKRMNICKL